MGNRTIKIGNSGDDVRDAQARLAHLGLLTDAEVDGKFGTGTVRAVLAFQSANGLTNDGVVGPATWTKLDELASDHVIPDWGTAGPAPEDHPSTVSNDGWWSGATRVPAHAGRMGPTIKPRTIVVHTTDTLPGSAGTIIRTWSTTPGNGACAHFVIARDGTVTQLVSIFRNGNHAGGTPHGNWKSAGALVHPNVWAIGIEIESGGRLGKRTAKGWVHPDTQRVIADDGVAVDAKGIGWQVVESAQLAALDTLLTALEGELAGLPADAIVAPDGDYKANGVDYFASLMGPRIVGHVTLDPVNKTDPGPHVMTWLVDREHRKING